MSTESRPDLAEASQPRLVTDSLAVAPLAVAPLTVTTHAATAPGQGAPGTEPVGRFGVPGKLLAGLLLANGFVWMTFFTPILAAMPAKVRELSPDHYTSFYSLALTVGAIAGVVSGPVAGRLSDRSKSRFGRRRPWLVGAMAIGVVGILMMAFALAVPVFVVGSVVAQIGFGGVTAVQLALLPEHVPAARRGAVGGLLGVSTAVSTIIGVVLTGIFTSMGHIPLAFISVVVLGVLGLLFLVKVLPDPRYPAAAKQRTRPADWVKAFYISPRKHPDFAWGWLSRFAVYLSLASVTTYQLYYLSDQIGISTSRAESIFVPIGTAAQVLTTVVGAVVFGPLSDRVGRRKPFVAGAAVVALAGLVSLALATDVVFYLLGIFLIGLAGGIYASVDMALMTAVLPNDIQDAGRDLGVLNIANALPNTLAPAFAPVLLAIGLFSVAHDANGKNYTMLFLGSAVFAAISVFAVLKVRSVR